MEEVLKSIIEENSRLHSDNNRLTRDITEFVDTNRKLIAVNEFLITKIRELEEKLGQK